MKPIVVSETIHAPIDLVFQIASDIPNAADRIRGITEIEMLSDGPMGEGTKWRETRIMFGKKATETMWVIKWDPPNEYVVEARSCGTHYLTPITFEEVEPGITKMTFTFTGTPETFMAKVLSKVFAAMTKSLVKCLVADLADIKAACESAHASSESTETV